MNVGASVLLALFQSFPFWEDGWMGLLSKTFMLIRWGGGEWKEWMDLSMYGWDCHQKPSCWSNEGCCQSDPTLVGRWKTRHPLWRSPEYAPDIKIEHEIEPDIKIEYEPKQNHLLKLCLFHLEHLKYQNWTWTYLLKACLTLSISGLFVHKAGLGPLYQPITWQRDNITINMIQNYNKKW